MSFRARLTLFFVLIVIVPMLSVAIVLFRLISDNETGKADAGLRVTSRVAVRLYEEARAEADEVVAAVGTDRRLAAALRDRREAAAQARARALLAAREIERIELTGGDVELAAGSPDAIAPTERTLVGAGGERFGTLAVSVTGAAAYARELRAATGADVAVTAGGRILATTVAGLEPADVPAAGTAVDVDVGGESRRAVTVDEPGFGGRTVAVTVFVDEAGAGAVTRSRWLAAGILVGFLVLALTFAVAVSRSLQAQIGSFLAAARRIASGDFSTEVTTTGRDEFAELGAEFNKMSHQLAARLEDLRQERARLETSLRRIGETFASNLDRDALLEIVVRTAVDGLGADGGRANARPAPGRPLQEVVRAGEVDARLETLRRAEAGALAGGGAAEASDDGAHALAHALSGTEPGELLGMLSVVRAGAPFEDRDRELLSYLAGSASVSIQNVALHEAVQRQAVTDELTGLFNHRRFQEAIVAEVERARRFGQPMSLVMLDIDHFKRVNDTHGHQQGDRVLAEVARVLRDRSREIDAPARYGGEELALVVPQTDAEGAYQLAERVRQEVEALEIPLLDGSGSIRVTASLGVASLPADAEDGGGLIAAADAALYAAKRAGRNKTVRADGKV
ncbi:MAG: diguanylate cyclase [Solirubrobacteraceae bacterium]|nr:diguanylate cyclase [Solirubrobacteraceae bacterium]